MTDVNPPTSNGQSGGGRESRAGHQAAGERPGEARTFADGRSAVDRPVHSPAPGADVGLQHQHEAVQTGQEMILVGQQVAAQTAELWRQALEPLGAWRNETARWFDYAWRQMSGLGVMRPMQTARPFGGGVIAAMMGAPAADLQETDDAYLLDVEVPGMVAEDLKLNIKDGRLALSGQKTQARHGDGYQISERRYGCFERHFPLPADVDRKAIDAELESGVLKIRLPKAAAASGERSKIEVRG